MEMVVEMMEEEGGQAEGEGWRKDNFCIFFTLMLSGKNSKAK